MFRSKKSSNFFGTCSRALARANAGAPGVDKMTFKRIDASGADVWRAGLREELVSKTYRLDPARRVTIPKPGGGERPLGIPTIRDRVVQTAAKIVPEPIFEADFEDSAHGYRPRRGAVDEVKETPRPMWRGYTGVVDADLSKYFDTIPHSDLLKPVARRIAGRHVPWLIKPWLKAPAEERDGEGMRRMSGAKSSTRGTPQGGGVSPLLSVVYMNRFPKHWRLSGRGEAFRAHVVSHADDFVILSRGCAEEALTWTKAAMAKLGLTLNETKTPVKDARRESFDFLGYTLGPRHFPNGGRWYPGAAPSRKSVPRIKTKVSALLMPGNKSSWPRVCEQLNRLLGGWAAYFSHGSLAPAYQAVDRHVHHRVCGFLRKRHRTPGRGTQLFPREQVLVLALHRVRKVSPSCGL